MRLTPRFLAPLAALFLALPALAADKYEIDPVHSEVGYHIRHFFTKTSGGFTRFKGTILVDEKDLTKSSVDVTIETASIETHNEMRDKHLKGPDFFDVAKYPSITFRSTKVVEVSKGILDVTGAFTLHGVTKPLVLRVASKGTMPGMKPGTFVAGFEGQVTFKRSDFGMETYLAPKGPLGDEVEVTLNIEAGKVQ